MGFFFALVALTALLIPIFVSADGAFSLDRKLFFVSIKVYGIRMLSIKVFFDEKAGILVSVNGKNGKPLSMKEKKKQQGKKKNYLPLITALYFTKADITVYAGGEPRRVSLMLAFLQMITETFLSLLPRSPDVSRVTMLPCYTGDQTTVKFSIKLFTSVLVILFALAHTRKEEKDAKRSNREFDG